MHGYRKFSKNVYITSLAASWPTRPHADCLAFPASSSPSPLTWLWEAIRWVFVVLFTSSIFMVSVTKQICRVQTSRRVYSGENDFCASKYFSPPQSAPKLKTQGNLFPCELLGETNGNDTMRHRLFRLLRNAIGPWRLIRNVYWLKFSVIHLIHPVHQFSLPLVFQLLSRGRNC